MTDFLKQQQAELCTFLGLGLITLTKNNVIIVTVQFVTGSVVSLVQFYVFLLCFISCLNVCVRGFTWLGAGQVASEDI